MPGSSVIRIIPQACSENSPQGMNMRNKTGQSVMVFYERRRRMTHVKQQER